MRFPLRKSAVLRIVLPAVVVTLIGLSVIHLLAQWELPGIKSDIKEHHHHHPVVVPEVNVPVEKKQVPQEKRVIAVNKQHFQVNRALSNDRNVINRQLQAERNQYMKLEEEFSKRKTEYVLNVTKLKYLMHDSEEKLRLLNTSYQQLKTKHDNLVASSNLREGKANQNNDQTELQGEIKRLKDKVMSLEQRLWSSTEKLRLIKNQLNGDTQGGEGKRQQPNAISLGRYLQDEQFADKGEEVVDGEK